MEDEISVSENIQDQKKKKSTAAGYAVSFLIKTGVTVIAIWILLDFIIGVFVCHDNNAYPMGVLQQLAGKLLILKPAV